MRPSSEGARGCGFQCAHPGQHIVPDRVDRRFRLGAVTRAHLGGDAECGRHGQAVAPHHVDAVSLMAQNVRWRRRVAIQQYHGSCGHPDVQARPRSKPNPASVPTDVLSPTAAPTVPSNTCLGWSGLRTPNVTWWPRLCHPVPNERPTLPAPMIAILIVAPLRCVRLAGYLYLSRDYLMI